MNRGLGRAFPFGLWPPIPNGHEPEARWCAVARERCAVMARNRMLGFHGELRTRIGAAYREYKFLEVDRLDRAFEAILRSRAKGADFVGYAVHRLSWDQALPNVNHRTTLSFTHAMLTHNGVRAPWAESVDGLRHGASTEAWLKRSKAIMADREMWTERDSAWEKLRRQHKDETYRWIRGEDQSGRLAYAAPHFLKNFLSCDVRKGRGGG